MKKIIYSILAVLFVLISCEIRAQGVPETVMNEGMSITVTNKTGVLTITAGKGYERSYTWDGTTRTQTLIPRDKRWAGKFGIILGNGHFKDHNTISEGIFAEEQLHFKTIGDAMSVLNHRGRSDGNTVYNDQGLMVTWYKAIHPYKTTGNVLIVEVYQVYIDGKKPEKLPNSQNDKIIVKYIEEKGS